MTILDRRARPITVAILAMGGEGGGVLSDWIVDLGEHHGFIAQATSVPGVAQRTGATIYYVELFPRAAADAAGRAPVLGLMPMPGDVDVVIASELMEAGRALQRGFVTPDRTTLIASSHRVYAMTERIALADGRVDDAALLEGCRTAAKAMLAFDMAALAEANGSMISAVLFGVLAGAGALPFARADFEAAVGRSRVGGKASLAAFRAGFEAAEGEASSGRHRHTGVPVSAVASVETSALPPPTLDGRNADAGPDLLRDCPPSAREVVELGHARMLDYQGPDYARLYLDRLQPVLALDTTPDSALLRETARQLALGMAYEDAVRVAELKTRATRFDRVREEVRLAEGQVLEIAEFMHPRVEEIADTLPARFGKRLLETAWLRRLVGRVTSHGRIVRTSTITGFLQLYLLARLKPWRPRSLRYEREQAFLEQWLATVLRAARSDTALAIELAVCRNLVRGYGDTHARGLARYDAIIAALPRIEIQSNAADLIRKLRQAALAEESGEPLDAAVQELAHPSPSAGPRALDARTGA